MKKLCILLLFVINSTCAFSQEWIPVEMRYNLSSGTVYAFVEFDKIVVKTSKSTFVVSDADSVGKIQNVIQNLFIEKRTPVVSDTIEINSDMKISHRSPLFSAYKKNGDNKDMIAFYLCDSFRFRFCDDFQYLLKFMGDFRDKMLGIKNE